MLRGTVLFRFGCLVEAALLASCTSHKSAQSPETAHLQPLNVLVVTIDTLRPDHLHCYGYANIETPNLDGLAQRGVLFENAVAQAPLTPPSHASIFTGQYPTVHHVRNTGGFILPSSSRPLARILQEQGWDTAAFVSSAVLKKVIGFNNGFAVYDDQMPRQGNKEEFGEDAERRGGDTVDRAVHWLSTQSGKPYFLWVHLYDPHLPYDPPDFFKQKYRERPYDGEIAYTDQQLGRLLEAVGKKAPVGKTIIAVLSDHGESLSEHGEFTHGVFLYDATLRIPFLIAGAGIPAGTRVKQQVRSIDFLPTLLTLLGGKPPANIQGVNLVPAFSGKAVDTAISYEETLYPKLALGWAELRGIRTNRWKYIRAPKPELYDLAQDPKETTNVLQQHPAEVERLSAQLTDVVGNGGSEKVETKMVDERQMAQLRSLGYLSGFSPQEYDLNGGGPDPKDQVGILKLLYEAENPAAPLPEARRIALLQQALREDPNNPSLYHQVGGELEKTGRYAEALRLYQTALQHGVENGRLHSRIADLSLRKGNKDTAIAEYEKAAQFNPSDLESQTNLATAYLEKGRATDAERVFKFVVASDPDSAAGHNGLGLIAIQKRDMPSARTEFEKAVQIDPDLVEAQMNLGLIYEMAGDRARARTCFEAFLAKASPKQYASIIPKVKQELATLQ
ncbi:MAG TPA: sulfatase-like hydrolase/transferase [Bryobacteraceae bacterium]